METAVRQHRRFRSPRVRVAQLFRGRVRQERRRYAPLSPPASIGHPPRCARRNRFDRRRSRWQKVTGPALPKPDISTLLLRLVGLRPLFGEKRFSTGAAAEAEKHCVIATAQISSVSSICRTRLSRGLLKRDRCQTPTLRWRPPPRLSKLFSRGNWLPAMIARPVAQRR